MRAFAWFITAILAAGALAACLAFPAYQLSTHVAAWAFHRVGSRIAMLILIAELVFLCRYLRLTTKRDFGYGLPWRRFVAQSAFWSVVGMLTAAAGAAFLLATQLRVVDPHFVPSPSGYLRIFAVGLGSGIAVALIEETLVRGAMHTAIERESGAWAAAWLTAPLFAVLHLYAKARIPADQLHWASGFDLIARSFAPLGQPALVFDSLVSWLVVGLILSYTRICTGNIAMAIGLHAGWVIVLRMLQESTVRSAAPSFWVGRFDGLVGYWLVPWGMLIGAGLIFTRRRWRTV